MVKTQIQKLREHYGLDEDVFTDEDVRMIHGWVESDTYVLFDGQNCNDWLDPDEADCLGWDGHSRRCDCGNRRVSWVKQFGYVTPQAF